MALVYCGAVIGLLAASFLRKILTEKTLIVIALAASLVGSAVTLLSWSPVLAVIGLALCQAGGCVLIDRSSPFMADISMGTIQITGVIMTTLATGLAAPLTAFVFWVIRPWEVCFGLLVALPVLLSLLLALWLLE